MSLSARIEAALAAGDLRRAASLAGEWRRAEPRNPVALQKAADIAFRRFEFAFARGLYRECLALAPERWPAWLNLAYIERLHGESQAWREAIEQSVRYCPEPALAARLHSNLLVHLHAWPELTQEDLSQEIRDWVARHWRADADGTTAGPSATERDGALRVAYLSGNFGGHVFSALLPAVLAEHDPACVQVTLVSTSQGLITLPQAYAQAPVEWLRCPPERLTEALAGRFDVLVDLDGHTPTGNLFFLTRRIAPVQLCWLDWFDTTGVPLIDGFISDAISTPPCSEAHFTERVWRLPHFRLPYCPPAWLDQLPLRQRDICRPFHFGCFSRLDKLHGPLLASWARILAACPESRLVLKSGLLEAGTVRELYLQRFKAYGIGVERLRLLGQTDYRQHLAALAEVDLILDTWPYTGGVSSFDALAMGVPVLTLAGQTMVARQTAALLHDCGLTRFTAQDAEQYEAKAIEFARHPERLPSPQEVRAALLASPSVDAASFARSLERLYQEAWQVRRPD